MECIRKSGSHQMADVFDEGQDRDLLPNSSDKFPQGLRVLVFDEDPAYLLMLNNHLKKCQYQVTGYNDEEKAMNMLRNHSDQFDIAIIAVQIRDGDDRLRLISEIVSETNIPIIVMSKEILVQSVINWMENGARDYLLKPLKPEDLSLLFKHVVKRRVQEKEKPYVVVAEEEKEAGAIEKSSSVGDSTIRNLKKRKRESSLEEPATEEENNYHSSTSKKKRRVVWDEDLHKRFIEAVKHLGNKAVPKKILEVMNYPGLTRENVASHLQKYRLNEKKQKSTREREERNQSLVNTQQGRMYGREEATNEFYRGRNVQNSTHEMNNHIPPSCVQQSTNPNPSVTTHHDGSLLMTHPPHNQNQTSECPYFDEGYNIDNEHKAMIANITCSFTQNPGEELGNWYQFQEEPVMATTNDQPLYSSSSVEETSSPQMMNPEPPMVIPPYPSFPNQQEIPMIRDENGEDHDDKD